MSSVLLKISFEYMCLLSRPWRPYLNNRHPDLKLEPKGVKVNGTQIGSALLVVDVQSGLFRRPTPIYKASQLLGNITALVERAHRTGVPVFYIQHADKHLLVEGTGDWALHPHIRPLDMDLVIHKRHGSAFRETALVDELERRGVGRVMVTGLVTHGCVKATCLDALELGYEVVLVADAHSSFSEDAARLTDEWNEKLRKRGVDVKPTQAVTYRSA